MYAITTTVKYILLTAIRDRLFMGLFLLFIIVNYLSGVLASTALIEQSEMSSVFSAGSSRIVAIFGVIIFVCFQVRTLFDNKEINIFITKPITRTGLIISFFLSYILISFLLTLFLAGLIFLTSTPLLNGALLWLLSIFLEMIITALVALFASLMLKSAVSCVLFSCSFYIFARLSGFLLMTIDAKNLFENQYVNIFFELCINLVSIIVPRFDLYTNSAWLIYDVNIYENLIQILQSLVFLPLIILLIIIDFSKKEF